MVESGQIAALLIVGFIVFAWITTKRRAKKRIRDDQLDWYWKGRQDQFDTERDQPARAILDELFIPMADPPMPTTGVGRSSTTLPPDLDAEDQVDQVEEDDDGEAEVAGDLTDRPNGVDARRILEEQGRDEGTG